MTTIPSAIALEQPIRGVRVLSRSANADAATRGKVKWLVSLGEQKTRREAELKALQATAQAVQRAMQQSQVSVTQRTDELAALVVELGLSIVGAALDRGDCDPTPTVVHCLRDCVHGSDEDDLVVKLHPDDLALVSERLRAMPDLADAVAKSKFVADATLGRGEVRASTDAGKLRYDPRETFERVASAVRNAAQGGQS